MIPPSAVAKTLSRHGEKIFEKSIPTSRDKIEFDRN